MKQANTFLRQSLDERQLAILVGLCVAACREALRIAECRGVENPEAGGTLNHVIGMEYTTRKTERQVTATSQSDNHENPQVPFIRQKLLLSVAEAVDMLSMGRTQVYDLVMRRQIASIKIGRSRRIPLAALQTFIAEQLQQAEQAEQEGKL
jgi:excisionase family DNA binding protein